MINVDFIEVIMLFLQLFNDKNFILFFISTASKWAISNSIYSKSLRSIMNNLNSNGIETFKNIEFNKHESTLRSFMARFDTITDCHNFSYLLNTSIIVCVFVQVFNVNIQI